MNTSSSLSAAQLLGITTSLFLSGSAFTYSYSAASACLLAPPTLGAAQWKHLYTRGRALSPPLAIVAMGAWVYCAAHTDWAAAYLLAAGLVVANLPWTLVVMVPTNAAIGNISLKGESVGDAKRLKELVARWTWMNAVRCVLPAVGGVVGTWKALGA